MGEMADDALEYQIETFDDEPDDTDRWNPPWDDALEGEADRD